MGKPLPCLKELFSQIPSCPTQEATEVARAMVKSGRRRCRSDGFALTIDSEISLSDLLCDTRR